MDKKTNFTKLPREIRDTTVKNTTLRPSAKFVLLCITYIKSYNEHFSPSYQFMDRRFGISQPTFNRAVLALEELGYIQIIRERENLAGYKRNVIVINWKKIDSGYFDAIPNHIINTDVYTNDQKLFLILVWKYIRTDEDGALYVSKGTTEIIEDLKGLGIGACSIKDRIRELSYDNGDFVNYFIKKKRKLYINHLADICIAKRCIESFERCEMNKAKYPQYVKPKAGDFKIDIENKKIIKTNED